MKRDAPNNESFHATQSSPQKSLKLSNPSPIKQIEFPEDVEEQDVYCRRHFLMGSNDDVRESYMDEVVNIQRISDTYSPSKSPKYYENNHSIHNLNLNVNSDGEKEEDALKRLLDSPGTFQKRLNTKETDQHRLLQRQKQIDIGKNTNSYRKYRAAVPKDKREPGNPKHPSTPRKVIACSKRSFDGQIKKWKTLLHTHWEPVGDEDTIKVKNVADNVQELLNLTKEEEELEKLLQSL